MKKEQKSELDIYVENVIGAYNIMMEYSNKNFYSEIMKEYAKYDYAKECDKTVTSKEIMNNMETSETFDDFMMCSAKYFQNIGSYCGLIKKEKLHKKECDSMYVQLKKEMIKAIMEKKDYGHIKVVNAYITGDYKFENVFPIDTSTYIVLYNSFNAYLVCLCGIDSSKVQSYVVKTKIYKK